MAKPSRLEQIASDMRATLAATQASYAHYKLQRGLELVLQRTDRGFRLALGRTDAPPSDVEIEVCQAAFRVPPGVDATLKRVDRPGKAGSRTYHVAEMHWSETA